jgi:hypothetical protein
MMLTRMIWVACRGVTVTVLWLLRVWWLVPSLITFKSVSAPSTGRWRQRPGVQ